MHKLANFITGHAPVKRGYTNVVKLSASWQHKPLAERSRSRQNRFDPAQRTA